MKQRLINKMKMYGSVINICTTHAAVWTGMEAFETAFLELKASYEELELTGNDQLSGTKGITLTKDEKKDLVLKKAVVAASALGVYAASSKNTLLKEQVRTSSYWELGHGSIIVIIQRIENIITLAEAHLPNLGASGF